MKIYMKYCLASYLHKWRVRDKLFNAITRQHFRTYVCVCVSVCVCGVGWELGWRRVWPMAAAPDVLGLSLWRTVQLNQKRRKALQHGWERGGTAAGNWNVTSNSSTPLSSTLPQLYEWLSFSVYASSHNQISWHSAFLNLIFQIAFSSF